MAEESIIKLKDHYQIMFASKPSNKSDLNKCFYRLKSSIKDGDSYKRIIFLPIIGDVTPPTTIQYIYNGIKDNSLIQVLGITKEHIESCFGEPMAITILEYNNGWSSSAGNIIKYNYKDKIGDLEASNYYLPLYINKDITKNKSDDNFAITFGFNMKPSSTGSHIEIDPKGPVGKKILFLKDKQQTISNEYDPADIGKMLPIIQITKDTEKLVCLKGKKYIYDHTSDPTNITIYGEWSLGEEGKIKIKTIEKKSLK